VDDVGEPTSDFGVPEIPCGATCYVLHIWGWASGLSTGCRLRLPLAQAVAAAAVRRFGFAMGSFCVVGILLLEALLAQCAVRLLVAFT
jgi:hypothetical protein